MKKRNWSETVHQSAMKIDRRLYKVFADFDHSIGVLEVEERIGPEKRRAVSLAYYEVCGRYMHLMGQPRWARSRGVVAIKVRNHEGGWGSVLYFLLVDQPRKLPRSRP